MGADNQRLFLFVALSFVALLLWEAWQRDYGPASHAPPTLSPSLAEQAGPDLTDLPEVPVTAEAAPAAVPISQKIFETGQRIRVITDVLDIEIDTQGGDIRQAKLRKYPVALDTPEQAFPLLGDQIPTEFIVQSGLRSPDGAEPTHHVRYQTDKTEYRLAEGQSELRIVLRWADPTGIQVNKTYTFYRGNYEIKLEHEVNNQSDTDWRARQYRQLHRRDVDTAGGSRFVYTYTGGVIYSPEEKYEKIDFGDMADEELRRSIRGGWAAMIQHYFVAAWVPNPLDQELYYSKALPGERYVLGLVGPQATVTAGGKKRFESTLYVGPKLQDRLAALAPGLELTVDYGILTVLAKPVFWLLTKIHSFIGNWGWAIAFVTLLIKLAFFKLSEASYKSMANMRRLAPRMKALKERFGDDRQKLNQAMMDMYKTEKINPLGGCLPILVQIPVFIALYWVLLESVELRQAPFMLWLNDLSAPDPYYVLPLIMGATMFIQQKLNPAPIDPIQAKIMMLMPIVFTVFFAFFPSGLVLYWVVNNSLSIAQQWAITRKVEQASLSRRR